MPEKVLIVDDEEPARTGVAELVGSWGYRAEVAKDGLEALDKVITWSPSIVVTDLAMPRMDGMELIQRLAEQPQELKVVVVTANTEVSAAVEAMKLGAYDFVQKPVDVDHLLLLLRRCREYRELRYENILLKDEFRQRYRLPAIVGESPRIVEVSNAIQRVAPTDSTVLLQGESGTGKELFARAIHQLSPRRARAFVAVNCAAIPDTLIENELFGHEKGAFTGASARQLGKFELADTGTIFLDEIGDLGASVQSKILRVLQERQFERVGGALPVDVDVRVICATNRNLADDVRERRFREDLFFRINVFPVTIPPLRERAEDIDALADFFLQKFAREMKKPSLKLTVEARAALRAYDWPGNIRELQNALERAAILCDAASITPRDLGIAPRDAAPSLDLSGTLADALRSAEAFKIADALRRTASRAEAAEMLGIAVRTLAAKMKELGIEDL